MPFPEEPIFSGLKEVAGIVIPNATWIDVMGSIHCAANICSATHPSNP
jgi:hypothetical protein